MSNTEEPACVCVLPAVAEPGLLGSPAVCGCVCYEAAPGGGEGHGVREQRETLRSVEHLLTKTETYVLYVRTAN